MVCYLLGQRVHLLQFQLLCNRSDPSGARSSKNSPQTEMNGDLDDEDNDPNKSGMASRRRLRWTHELHERFVDAVAQLGGPDRATPKGVLKLMGVQGLTIYHIKSHLQKYRLAKFPPESSQDANKGEMREQGDLLSDVDNTSGMQITDALKLQMEVQKRLHEQLEVQRQLQLRIEAQGKYLKKIIEEQQRLSGVLAGAPGVDRCLETDPSTPAPSSETPLQDKPTGNDYGLLNEPLTPDSSGRNRSPSGSPKRDWPVKRHRGGERATGHPSLMFPGGSHFDPSSVGGDDRFGNRFRSDL